METNLPELVNVEGYLEEKDVKHSHIVVVENSDLSTDHVFIRQLSY